MGSDSTADQGAVVYVCTADGACRTRGKAAGGDDVSWYVCNSVGEDGLQADEAQIAVLKAKIAWRYRTT
jgi:hypothetical protein